MNQTKSNLFFRHWKAVLAALLIFASGCGFGVAAAAFYYKRALQKLSDPSTVKRFVDSRFNRLAKELEFTPEQMDKIRPLMEQNALEIKKIRDQATAKTRQLRRQNLEQIVKFLTPQQKERLEEIIKRRERKMKPYRDKPPLMRPEGNVALPPSFDSKQ